MGLNSEVQSTVYAYICMYMYVVYRKSENFRVQKLSGEKFSCPKIFGYERPSEN